MGLIGRVSFLSGNAGSVRTVTLTLIFGLILCGVPTEYSTWASTSPAKKNGIRVSTGQSSVVREQSFPASWRISRFVAKEGPGGVYGARIFERQVKDGKSTFSIGNIVQFEFPKSRLTKRVAAQESEALAEFGKCEESKRGFAMDLPAGVCGEAGSRTLRSVADV
jgi:hypothetical protein